jgi:hypothetical protein
MKPVSTHSRRGCRTLAGWLSGNWPKRALTAAGGETSVLPRPELAITRV